MKKSILLLMLVLAMLLSACEGNEATSNIQPTSPPPATLEPTPTTKIEPTPPVQTAEPALNYTVPEVWEGLNASFVRDDSSQYSNAILNLKYLGEVFALFEFRLMEGSEDEDFAFDTTISGVMLINDDGSASYETADGAENPLSIYLTLTSANGDLSADVTHSGDFTISPDGHYYFIEDCIEVSEAASTAILEHLPTAATSLNHNNGEYTINFPDAFISEWFYTAEAVFNDSGATLAKFIIAKDLSAVFRVDDDIEPTLIYGSAQPMMEAYVMDMPYEEDYEEPGEGEEYGEPNYEPRMLVEVILPGGVFMQTGTADTLEVILPYDLPCTLTAVSEDDSIATVDENGEVTAVSEGETVINCRITCEDGVAIIGLAVTVSDNLELENF